MDVYSNPSRLVGLCCLVVIVALYVVGAVSHGVLRHIVQALPLWVPFVLGFEGRELAKWAALPCLLFWLVLMVLIWLFLLNVAHVVTGHFSPTEIAMTVIIGLACALGLFAILRWRSTIGPAIATGTVLVFALLQLLCFRLSLLPSIAHR